MAKAFRFEVRPRVPRELCRLTELSANLMYSWDEDVRSLFSSLDRELWERVGHNPRLFLRRVDQAMLDNAAQDALYQRKYNSCVSSYDTYMGYGASESVARAFDVDNGLIAYFCAEFGLHESFPIYSGGLGILAGDHCKAASDLRLPFVAVGLLYRQGYFSQTDRSRREAACELRGPQF